MPRWLERIGMILSVPLWIVGGLGAGLVIAATCWWLCWDEPSRLGEGLDDED